MKIYRFISLLLILGGVLFISYSAWNIIKAKQATNNSLEEVKELIETKSSPEATIMDKEEFKPITGDAVGILKIPALKAELPIVEGTDPDDLDKGVGHYRGSYYPTDGGQIVLSGHRDTVFRNVGKLNEGDSLVIRLPYGDFTYQITGFKIVEANDTSIITLQNEQEELLLTTCYPFNYVGDAPQRYIIYAKKVEG